jgi:hypothetical protein
MLTLPRSLYWMRGCWSRWNDNVFELYYLPLNCQINCRIQLLGMFILIHHLIIVWIFFSYYSIIMIICLGLIYSCYFILDIISYIIHFSISIKLRVLHHTLHWIQEKYTCSNCLHFISNKLKLRNNNGRMWDFDMVHSYLPTSPGS